MTPVAVLGAGIAGLIAARELSRNGFPVRVFEAAPKIAGLSTTHRDDDGFSYDIGAHFITNRLAAAVGVSGQCRLVHHYGETVYLDGRFAGYPYGLLMRPRFLASALKARVSPRTNGVSTAEEWFIAEYGSALAHEVALPLLEAWSGAPASQLAASVGAKMPTSIAQTMFLTAMAKASDRAVSVGYCWAKPPSAAVWHVYPENGVSTLCERLAENLPGVISVNSPVEKIIVEGEKVRAVRVGGEQIPVRAVVSTAPVNLLPKLVEGTERLERFRRFKYRPMVLVNLKLHGRNLLPDVVVWLPTGFPFFRLTEATQSMPWLAPEDKTLVLCDIGAEVGDEHWTMNDDDLGEYCVTHLETLIPDIRDRYIGCSVVRTPIAYPVYLREYENDRLALGESTGVEGLISVGRHGEFSHNLMEDVYWTTIGRVHSWMQAEADHDTQRGA
ncbi:MAG: FAD-dependent oxidoreductase [Ilumatobacteraceae bacterium]|nr:FAD-dependent oxidoreductase [Ilumatobacteraceae bacterium]